MPGRAEVNLTLSLTYYEQSGIESVKGLVTFLSERIPRRLVEEQGVDLRVTLVSESSTAALCQKAQRISPEPARPYLVNVSRVQSFQNVLWMLFTRYDKGVEPG